MSRKKKVETTGGEKSVIDVPKLSKTPQLVKGMKDVLPSDQPYWDYVRTVSKQIADHYGFDRIDTPMVEDLSLYVHGVGKQTDIVEKEMFTLADQGGGGQLVLRPEFTAAFVRAYIEHGMVNQPQPVKLYSLGPLFRHEKPQADRFRQHHQFNCEVMGEASASVDAQLILMAQRFYKMMRLGTVLHVNSIGCGQCRPSYRDALTEYYKNKRSQMCEDCKRRYLKNPLRLLDCKSEECQQFKSEAPQTVDFLCEECRDHFMKLLDFLEEFEIPYQLDYALVRGMDYYTRTVFEFYSQGDDSDRMIAVGGGGRYDALSEILGGRPTPGCGFGIGIERVISRVKELEKADETVKELFVKKSPDIFFAQLGDQAKRKSMVLYESLIDEGFLVAEGFCKDNLKAQLELANKSGARFTLILGQKELLDGTIIIRNMEGGEQEVINIQKLIPTLHKKLEIV